MAEVTESAPEAAPAKPESATSHTLTRVATAGVLIPLVLALVLWAPRWLFVSVLAVVALLTLREYLDLAEKAGLAPLRYLSYVWTLLLLTWTLYRYAIPLDLSRNLVFSPFYRVVFWFPAYILTPLLILLALTLAMRSTRSLDKALPGASATVLGPLYIGLSLSLLVDIRNMDRLWVVYILTLTWVSDSAAYFVGRDLGRHRLAARISPGKSWEGAIASLIVGVAFGVVFTQVFPSLTRIWYLRTSWLASVLIAVLVNVAGQVGDLAESALKRSAGVKDSSTILPGHGGFLDRLDALLFAIPALWYILVFIRAVPDPWEKFR